MLSWILCHNDRWDWKTGRLLKVQKKWKSKTLSACIYHWLGDEDMLMLYDFSQGLKKICVYINTHIYTYRNNLKEERTITWKKVFKERLVPPDSVNSVFKSFFWSILWSPECVKAPRGHYPMQTTRPGYQARYSFHY